MGKRILVDGTLQAMSDTVKRFYPDGFPECKPRRKAKVRKAVDGHEGALAYERAHKEWARPAKAGKGEG